MIIAAAAWLSGNNLQTKQCGNVVLEGYLAPFCPWQAYPWIPDYNSKYGDCSLDVWLSESPPNEPIPDACAKQPITSWCFLEKSKGLLLPPYSAEKVTLIGDYEKMNVCTLLEKCLDPECMSCTETDVFVPCEVTKTAS